MADTPPERWCEETPRGSHGGHQYMLDSALYHCPGGDVHEPSAESARLGVKHLVPVAVALERRQRAAKHHPQLMPPLPTCPICSTLPAEVIESTGRPMSFEARLLFKPCGHAFTATEDIAYEAAQEARSLVDDEENRPAGERVTAPCSQVRQREPHDAHDWFAPVDGRAHCPGFGEPDDGIKEAAPPQTVAEQVRDLERVIERVREAVGTDMALVGCEQHESRIGELATALREVLAQFAHDTHPGRRCKQTGHVNVETIARWQAVLDGTDQEGRLA